jgi:hypothetical protein
MDEPLTLGTVAEVVGVVAGFFSCAPAASAPPNNNARAMVALLNTCVLSMLYFLLVGEIKEYSLTENRFTSKDAGTFKRRQKQVAKHCTAGNHGV